MFSWSVYYYVLHHLQFYGILLFDSDRMQKLKGIAVKRIFYSLNDFYSYTNLIRELVSRDIKVRYRQSFLGILWTIMNPLMMMLIITIVFSSLFRSNIPLYPIYYLSGSLIFSFNSEATSNALNSIIANSSLIRKIYIPKYILPLSKVISCLINLLFSYIAMFIVMIAIKAPFKLTLVLLPIPIIYTFIFSLGLGLLLAAYSAIFRDIVHFYNICIMAWSYITPIFYPEEIVPQQFSWVLTINPLYHFIRYIRCLVIEGIVPDAKINLICLAFSVGMLFVGLFFFKRKQDEFILYL